MDINALEKAGEIKEKIEFLNSIKSNLQKEPTMADELKEHLGGFPEAIPPANSLNMVTNALAAFNEGWITHIDTLIAKLEEEIASL